MSVKDFELTIKHHMHLLHVQFCDLLVFFALYLRLFLPLNEEALDGSEDTGGRCASGDGDVGVIWDSCGCGCWLIRTAGNPDNCSNRGSSRGSSFEPGFQRRYLGDESKDHSYPHERLRKDA